jgi:hypothetical protein
MTDAKKAKTGYKLYALLSLYLRDKQILYSQSAKIYPSHQTFSLKL